MRIAKLTLLFLLSFCSFTEQNNSELVYKLEAQLDSTFNVDFNGGLNLADSIISLDPNNRKASKLAALILLNRNRPKDAIPYFKRAVQIDQSNPAIIILAGVSLERTYGLDSASRFYQLGLDMMDSSYRGTIGEPQLVTVLFGRERGMKKLDEYYESISSKFYHQLKNDIESYEGKGVLEFFPILDSSLYSNEFYVTIPDQLYDNGVINGMDKLELSFAKMGVNISCSGTDHDNKGFRFQTTSKYENRLLELDTFKIKRL